MKANDSFFSLQRLLQLATAFEKRHVSTSEGFERLAETQWSRRQFLKGAAAVAAIPLLPSLRMLPVRGQAESARVVVVGAGLSGLTAAYRLRQAGVIARVITARNRVGGRIVTVRSFGEGQTAELGGEFIGANDDEAIRLINELGLTLVNLQDENADFERNVYHFDNRRITAQELVDWFRPMAVRMIQDLNTLTGNVTYNQPNNGGELDQLSIAGWLDTRGVTGTLARIVDIAFTGRIGLGIDQQSGYNLLTTVNPDRDDFESFSPGLRQYRIAEGADSLPRRLAQAMEGQVEFQTVLEAIQQRSDGVYVLTFNRGGSVFDVEADEVILAIPFSTLRNVDIQIELPSASRLAIDTLGYSTHSTMVVGFSDRVWASAGSDGTTFSDTGYQMTWESNHAPDGGAIIQNRMGGQDAVTAGRQTPDQRAAGFLSQFDSVFAGASAAFTGQVESMNWVDDPFALGSRSVYLAGQMTTIHGVEGVPVDGLHFAGEHTSMGNQGRINGGVESGERAAAEVLSRLTA